MPTTRTDQLPLMSVNGALRELEAAGREGLLTGQLARRFAMRESYGGSIQRLLAEANTLLITQERMGNVEKSQDMEPSAYYHRTPNRRWHITDHGRAYLAAGGRAGIAGRAGKDREQGEARYREARERARHLLAAVPARDLRTRDALICQLRDEGELTFADIGELAGITRERARQIAKAGRDLREDRDDALPEGHLWL